MSAYLLAASSLSAVKAAFKLVSINTGMARLGIFLETLLIT
jgi:hypothetical protein